MILNLTEQEFDSKTLDVRQGRRLGGNVPVGDQSERIKADATQGVFEF